MRQRSFITAFTLAALSAVAAAQAADHFACTLTPASTASYDVSATAPFTGTMVGNTAATPATRTKTGSIQIIPPGVNCGTFGATQNDPLTISGSITATGSGSNIRPTGTFTLSIDTAAMTSNVRSLALNLLGTSTASVAGGLSNFRYPTFCTVNPTCSAPFLVPISLTLGNLDITAITALQTASTAGTLTPATGGGFDFSIPLTVEVTASATFNSAPFPLAPQTVPVVLNGRITVAGSTATVASTLNVDLAPPPPTTATTVPPTPITTPTGTGFCEGLNLILALTLPANTTVIDVSTMSSLAATGSRIPCRCDWDNSGSVSVQDIFAFLNGYFTGAGDFNGVGGTTVDDIFDFLICYFSRPFPC